MNYRVKTGKVKKLTSGVYLLHNRMKFYGYGNARILEGGIGVNDVEV